MWHLFVANLKMLVRDRLTIFWALVFPVMFLGIFALFNLDEPPEVDVALVDQANTPFSQALGQALDSIALFKVKRVAQEEEALAGLRNGDYDLALVLPQGLGVPGQTAARAYYSEANVQLNQMALGALRRFFDEFNLQAAAVEPAVELLISPVAGRDIGFMDFLTPGIVGMALMQYGIIGMATLLVTYREKRILRRIQTTPLPVATFLLAQVAAFLALALTQVAVILGIGQVVGADLPSTFFWAFPLALLGDLTFLNLGIVVAGLSRTAPAAAGMGNALALPMMFFSGVFFPTEQLPGALAHMVKFLPLAPLVEALRAVLLHRDPLPTLWDEVGLLALWGALSLVLAIRTFRME